MMGHITYMSDESMNEKFGRRFKEEKQPFKFSPEFEVEGYLTYRGDNFIKRFDPNSYLYVTKAIDYFDLSNGKGLQNLAQGDESPVPYHGVPVGLALSRVPVPGDCEGLQTGRGGGDLL